MKEMKVILTLTDEMLGTSPSDESVYRSYVASKAPDASTIEEEVAALGTDEVVEKGMTIFPRDEEGNPAIRSYLIKGFFKNACKAMREADGSESKNLTSYKTKIDNLIFISPKMHLTINLPEGKEVGVCERPLRAQTPQGERVALAISESVPAGSTIEFTIKMLKDDMEKYVIEWLDYGELNGLGCWHNSGKGTFTWKDAVGLDGEDRTAPKKRGRKKKEEAAE